MIVPRAFSAHEADLSEKPLFKTMEIKVKSKSKSRSPFRSQESLSTSTSELAPSVRSDPVRIPARTTARVQPAQRQSPMLSQPTPHNNNPSTKRRRESTQELLSATAIPARRRPRGRPSQRLPKCDFVADFSKLLLDDVKTISDGAYSRSASHSQLDALFGNIDNLVEGPIFVEGEPVDDNVLTIRSISSDSVTSLPSPDDYGSSAMASQRSSVGKSYSEKRPRQQVNPENCAGDHPLLDVKNDTTFEEMPLGQSPSPSPSPRLTTTLNNKKPGSFKSSLTASLKALRSAAQSVSSKASLFSSTDSEAYRAHTYFDFHPSLTDDKRPPPNALPPSAELRRYLNPSAPDSPAQLHIWHEDKHTVQQGPKSLAKAKSKSRRKSSRRTGWSSSLVDDLPPVVPLATCLPSSVRTAHASSPPIWLAPDGTPSNKQTAIPLLYDPDAKTETGAPMARSREPRENRDFLRIYVCEMEMRRNGKLKSELSLGRAKLWLPPIDDGFNNTSKDEDGSAEGPKRRKVGAERWTAWNIEDV